MAKETARDKARKARELADDAKFFVKDSRKIASKVAKGATGKDLTIREEMRAGKIIQQRRMNDTGKTARRAEFIADRTSKRSASARKIAAVTGGVKSKPTARAKSASVKKTNPAKKKMM